MTASNSNPPGADLTVDVVVAGSGIAGLTAASYAARHGKSVLLVEKETEVGGTSAISGGVLWTAPTYAEWRERCPLGIEELGRRLVADFPMLMDWLTGLGVEIETPVPVHDFAPGRPFDIAGYFTRAIRIIESAGGFVMRNTSARELMADVNGSVVGMVVREHDATDVPVAASAVVLATGGSQGDAHARARFIHPNAAGIAVRANPGSIGDGLRMATQIGAGTHALSHGFYGHLICSPLDRFEATDFNPLYLHFSHLCAMVNIKGERFTLERAGDHFNAQQLVPQPESRAVLIFDDAVYRSAVVTPNVQHFIPYDKFELARSRGAHTAVAPTIGELASTVAEWGFDTAGLTRSIESFNHGASDPGGWEFPVRTNTVPRITTAPFYAMEAVPAVTFCHSGIRIDDHARVLRDNDTIIRGLYACGVDAGGVYDRGYCGGLAMGGVFGLAAARDITGTL
jgi:succinate dehydrogenase/fumarate reductase flavoprotein subunit